MVGSYSSDIAPRAFSIRPFFSISNINVSTGSDNFFVSHQRYKFLSKNFILLSHQLMQKKIQYQILIVTKVFYMPDHDDYFQ